ncbi:sigma-like protein [Streptomyces sp. NPDC002454]
MVRGRRWAREILAVTRDNHATGGKTKPADNHATGGTARTTDNHATGGKP